MDVKVKNLGHNQVVIDVEGVIGEDELIQFGGEQQETRVSTFEKFRLIIEDISQSELQSLRINIRSAGGSLQDALLIYSLLQELSQSCEIETHCYGFSASAATIIAQAATPGKRFVASSALYMIHNSSTQFDGNAIEAESVAEMLSKTDAQIAQLYSQRSGKDESYFAEIMARDGGRGEWMTAQEAVDAGLADEVENFLSIKNMVKSIKGLFTKLFSKGDINESILERELEEKEGESIQNHEIKIVDSANENLPQNSSSEDSPKPEANEQETNEELQDREEYLLVDAEKTRTEPKEDPQLQFFASKSTENQSAYDNDVDLFRDR